MAAGPVLARAALASPVHPAGSKDGAATRGTPRLLSRAIAAMRRWPLWQLRPVMLACVLAVPTAAAAAIGVAAAGGPWRAGDLLRFLALAGCGLAAFEATRSVTATRDPLIPDQLAVWCLPIAVLLPPFWALVAPIPLLAFAQLRVHHAAPHRRVFGAAASGLAYGAASVTFHSVSSSAVGVTSPAPGTGTHALAWTLLVAGCGIVSWIVASGLAALAPAAGPGSQPSPLVPRRETVFGDFVQLSLGVAVTIVVAINPLLVIFAAPSILVQRRLLTIHSELVDRARTDAKTGLLNARAWEAAAEAEVVRARRTGSPLAAAIADVDHFKLINDTHGHLTGDRVLKEIAGVFRATVREYDLAGRFGGEEFALLFPDTNGADAVRIAERLRSRIASLRVTPDGSAGPLPVSVTVSVGVATLDTAGTGEAVLPEVLAAADTALYQAKDAGRNTVCRYRGAEALPDPRFPVTHAGQQATPA